MRVPRRHPTLAALALAGALAGAGCGEKIAIPEPEGVVGIKKYVANSDLELTDPRQLVVVQGGLFVVAADGLVKYDLEFGSGTAGPPSLGADLRALCAEHTGKWLFVWDQESRVVSWITRDSLVVGGSLGLESAQRVEAMAASPMGVEAVPGALTFVYLSDPGAGVVWRYAFDEFSGLIPYGLLARSSGSSVRDVRVPAGMVRDSEGFLFVCDRDTSRNWVIRFDPTPDEDDEDRRGRATLLPERVPCQPVPAAEDYVIGDAPACGETDWTGGVSVADGEFHAPRRRTASGGSSSPTRGMTGCRSSTGRAATTSSSATRTSRPPPSPSPWSTSGREPTPRTSCSARGCSWRCRTQTSCAVSIPVNTTSG
jgi:hypothetical protein